MLIACSNLLRNLHLRNTLHPSISRVPIVLAIYLLEMILSLVIREKRKINMEPEVSVEPSRNKTAKCPYWQKLGYNMKATEFQNIVSMLEHVIKVTLTYLIDSPDKS